MRLPATTSTTTPVPYVPSTQKPRRKQQQQSNKNNIPDVTKPKDFFIANPYLVDNDLVIPAVESEWKTLQVLTSFTLINFLSAPTQPPSRISLDNKYRNTQMPAPIPTHKTSWIDTSSAISMTANGLLRTIAMSLVITAQQVLNCLSGFRVSLAWSALAIVFKQNGTNEWAGCNMIRSGEDGQKALLNQKDNK